MQRYPEGPSHPGTRAPSSSSASTADPQRDLALLRSLRDSVLTGTHPLFRVPSRLLPLPRRQPLSQQPDEPVPVSVQEQPSELPAHRHRVTPPRRRRTKGKQTARND
ncbi:hypothetical protein JCM1841_003598 [Sporobolomyces salmonicolor]